MATDTTQVSPSTASSTSNGTSQKRKRPGADGVKYYAVREGRKPGVYYTWGECLNQVKGHKGALCQSSPSLLYYFIQAIDQYPQSNPSPLFPTLKPLPLARIS